VNYDGFFINTKKGKTMILGGRVFNPGDLRTLITLKQRSITTNDGGFQMPAWATMRSLYAKWVNAHGSEVWTADAAGATAPATVTIRYQADVDTTCAVEKDGVLYEIISIDDIQNRHELMELKVKRLVED
jgi:SPP1 family predicted phage head-tail adaptor